MQMIGYLDYNAGAPVRPVAAQAVAAALAAGGNASSVHGPGRSARRTIEDAREAVAALVGAMPEAVVFTSGGTEANDLALHGTGRTRIIVGATEHVSVLEAVPDAAVAPVDSDGMIALDTLESMLAASDAAALVSVMLANNETGVIQPLAEVARRAHAHGALVHCDAIQAAGKVPVSMAALGTDLLTLSAHKIGGPQGAGALVVAAPADLAPRLRGGGQERRRRAGTENVPGIAGFGAAAEAARADSRECVRLAALRDRLEAGVRALAPLAVIFGAGVARLPNTSCLAMPGVASEVQVMALDLAGVALSAGAACSSGKVQRSHVLDAMGVAPALAECAIRASLGWASRAEDVERFLAAWGRLYAHAGGAEMAPAA